MKGSAKLFEETRLIAEHAGRRRRPYPEYKPAGSSFVSHIPVSWTTLRLCYAVSFPTKSEIRHLADETPVSFVPMESLGEYGGLTLDAIRQLQDVINGYTYFRDGDVLVAKITPCFENGKGAIAHSLESGIGFGTTELHVLRPRPEMDTRFLFYITIGRDFRELGAAEMYGAGGQKRVPESFIRELRQPVPPLPEQQAIAAFLDRETGKIDALVEKKRRLIELLKEKRVALISHAVTKGLDPNVPMKDSGDQWLGEVPAHWEVKQFGYAVRYISYGFTNPMPSADEGPLMVTANDIGDGCVLVDSARRTEREAFDKLLTDKARPRKGDVLLTKDGTLGRVAVCDGEVMCINQSVALMRIRESEASIDFVQNTLRAGPYQTRMAFDAGGTTIKHIYITRLVKMPMAFPPLDEQEAICTYADRTRNQLDALIAKVTLAIARLVEYRTALISAAVTGKIDVRGEV